jgi:dolichyl-phosphate beta-glucosyltransferase
VSSLLVVPCFNEAGRWRDAYWRDVVEPGVLDVLFVNDGSSDATLNVLRATADTVGASVLDLPRNSGKAEAVRQGLIKAWDSDAAFIGYLDADGAFPASEVRRMAQDAADRIVVDGSTESFGYDAVWSARVLMAGRDIERNTSRHYLGRVITTVVAPWHGYAIYDTQARYKIFCKDNRLLACLQEPFRTRWFPDIELLQRWKRLNSAPMRIWEDPVTGWHDVAGSKMTTRQYQQIIKDLSWIYRGRT